MNLPEYEEFLKTITPEACEKLERVSKTDPKELKENMKKMGLSAIPSAITGENFSLMLGLLELYHKWLSEQLNRD